MINTVQAVVVLIQLLSICVFLATSPVEGYEDVSLSIVIITSVILVGITAIRIWS